MKRIPAVAGQFYPADPVHLKKTIEQLSTTEPNSLKQKATVIISPHAGFVYSGSVAAETINAVTIPDDVIILGPNHHGIGKALAVSQVYSWEMPFGDVLINTNLVDELCTGEPFSKDDIAHNGEHSLEVQIPFLQAQNPNFSLTAVCVSSMTYDDCHNAGKKLASVIKNQSNSPLILASTDMTHYESRNDASRKDEMALQCILNLDPEELYNTVMRNRISMCGIIPTTIALIAAKILGATSSQLIRYTDSGAVSGDTNQVVGYAGLIIN